MVEIKAFILFFEISTLTRWPLPILLAGIVVLLRLSLIFKGFCVDCGLLKDVLLADVEIPLNGPVVSGIMRVLTICQWW